MKNNLKRANSWILPLCWGIIGLQAIYILHTRKPEALRAIGLERVTHRFFSSIGLIAPDPFWELSQEEDRTRLKKELKSIDKYSRYLSEEQFESFSIDSRQEYEGIGVSLQDAPKGAEVREVFEGSPALRAGLQVGDVITSINHQNIRHWSFNDLVEHIRGSAGTVLHLRVIRNQRPLEMTVRRDAIDIPSIRNIHQTEDGIIYLKIEQFGEKTAQEFLESLRPYSNRKLRGLIIDLRENTGGVLSTSIDMLDAFYDRGQLMLQTRNTDNGRVKNFKAKRSNLLGDIPTVILVNRNSASASEILAGSLQVTGKALIIGEQSLGKGSIQTVYQLRKGDAYKKTTSYYYFPDGSTIHEVGIVPDITIELSDRDYYADRLRSQQGIAPYATNEDPYWDVAVRTLHSY